LIEVGGDEHDPGNRGIGDGHALGQHADPIERPLQHGRR
jgi:hypothetical protein